MSAARAMAERPTRNSAGRRNQDVPQTKGSRTSMRKKIFLDQTTKDAPSTAQLPNALPISPPNQIRRRPAELDLSALATELGDNSPSPETPMARMSVREKLLQGVNMDLQRLQKSPARFDKLFPPAPTAIPPHLMQPGAVQHPATVPRKRDKDEAGRDDKAFEEEKEESVRFEKRMRSV